MLERKFVHAQLAQGTKEKAVSDWLEKKISIVVSQQLLSEGTDQGTYEKSKNGFI